MTCNRSPCTFSSRVIGRSSHSGPLQGVVTLGTIGQMALVVSGQHCQHYSGSGHSRLLRASVCPLDLVSALAVMLCHHGGRGPTRRYLATAVLRSAAAQPSATARLGSACPGNVAHPAFITNSVCSEDDVMAVSWPSLPRATSAFSPATHIGTSAPATAASACLAATCWAVLLVVTPPHLKPTI